MVRPRRRLHKNTKRKIMTTDHVNEEAQIDNVETSTPNNETKDSQTTTQSPCLRSIHTSYLQEEHGD